jgi:GTPase SAR1 family protein
MVNESFNREKFREEVKTRLEKLNNPKLSAAFAIRISLISLPFLVEKADEKGFLWYWKSEEREKHLLAVLRASQVASCVLFNPAASDAAADAASAAAAAAAAADAASAAADAASAAAASAAAYAADAASAFNKAYYIIDFIKKELNLLHSTLNISDYLTSKINLPNEFNELKETFFNYLRNLPSFEYWADWLQDRYDGKPFNLDILEKSVLLPDEIKALTPREINRYLKQLSSGKLEEKIKRVRAIFIGDGEAGKTSLIQALNELEVKQGGTEMTPGIEISEWKVQDTDLIANFWDFGGQVIAHATHQFFLRSRCVYILVLNARSMGNNANQQVEYWLEFVRAFGEDAPVLLVGNKFDLTPVHLDLHRLKEAYPNIQGFFPFSATCYQNTYKEQFTIFKNALCDQLNKAGEIQPYFTKEQFQIIETLREKSRKAPFLSKVTFNKLCKEQHITDNERNSLLKLLDQLGEVIHFPDFDFLDEYLLNPRWLTYGIYPLLYSELLKKQHGHLTKSNVAEILKNHKVKDNKNCTLSYPIEKQYFLIQAMEQFKLCYPLDNSKTEWVVPDLLATDQPENLDFNKQNALRFDFKFDSFLPRHVLSMFIVEHYKDIKNNKVWQHGVRLYNKTWETDALVQVNYQSRTLSLEINGIHISDYFPILFNSILNILNKMPKLKYSKLLYLDEKARIDKNYFSHDNNACADFDDLLANKKDGKKEYTCKYGKYNLMEVLKLMPNIKEENQEVSKEIKPFDISDALKPVLGIFLAVIIGFTVSAWFLPLEKLAILFLPMIFILILLFGVFLFVIGKLQDKDFMEVVKNLFEKSPVLLNILERIFPSKNNTEQNNKTDGKN